MTNQNDLFISDLKRHYEILDAEIAGIAAKIAASEDPVADGLCDRSEYFIGAGFVAAQKYILETYSILDVEKGSALKTGPVLANGLPFVGIVWAAANYWKHDAEWWKGAIELGPPDSDGMGKIKISRPASGMPMRNLLILEKFGMFGRDYICSVILAELVDGGEFELRSLMPYLESWRACVERQMGGIQ